MTALLNMLVVPLSIFLVVVAPIWLILHYRAKRRYQQELDKEARLQLQTLTQTAQRLQQRLDTLEGLLDADLPGWRVRHGE